MKKKSVLICITLLLLLTACAAGTETPSEDTQRGFAEITGLHEVQEKLEAGEQILSLFYTDGYGFSLSEFTSADPGEIRRVWTALQEIELGGESDFYVTDWYPRLTLELSDGTSYTLAFNGKCLELGAINYELLGADSFWETTASLVTRYQSVQRAAEYGGSVLELYLPTKAEEGYRWEAEIENETLLYGEEKLFADPTQLGFSGSSAVQWYRFRGLEPGSTSITLSCGREGERPVCCLVYRVDIDEGWNILTWGFEMTVPEQEAEAE